MKIIERYIARELLIPFMVVITILAVLFTSFNSAHLLTGTSIETLGFVLITRLILLKTLIALEVLIPITFYISVIIGLSRLSKNQEISIFHAVGISKKHIVYIVLLVSIPIGIFSGIRSIYVRPWAYAESYILDVYVVGPVLNTNRFKAGYFMAVKIAAVSPIFKEKMMTTTD